MVNQSRGSHNKASANQDDKAYNPQSGGASGNAEYDDNLDHKKEDHESKRSEQSGQIPRSEFRIDQLFNGFSYASQRRSTSCS